MGSEDIVQKISSITDERYTQLTIEKKIFNLNCQLTELEINLVLESNMDLIHKDFTGWHRYQIKRLGKDRYVGMASEARRQQVSHRGKLFSKWLKQAI